MSRMQNPLRVSRWVLRVDVDSLCMGQSTAFERMRTDLGPTGFVPSLELMVAGIRPIAVFLPEAYRHSSTRT